MSLVACGVQGYEPTSVFDIVSTFAPALCVYCALTLLSVPQACTG